MPSGFGSDELLAQAMAATYGMVSMIDDGVVRILPRLDEPGVRKNIICFHGITAIHHYVPALLFDGTGIA